MSPRLRRAGLAAEWWLVLLASAALLTLAVVEGWTTRLDHVAYDAALRLRAASEGPITPEDTLIVAIDDRSLGEIGAWPWPRATQARLIEQLAAARPRVLGLDILLTEPRDPPGDARLAAALAGAGPAVLPVAFAVPGPAGQPFAVQSPLPAFRPANVTLGHVNLSPDADGVARRFYRTYSGQGAIWPALPASMLFPGRSYSPPPRASADVLTGADPLLIDWLGPPGTVATVSAGAVLRGEVPATLLSGRHVLVGITASGLGDYHATPFGGEGALMAGVEIQANVLATLGAPHPLRPLAGSWPVIFALIPLLLVFLAMRQLSPPAAGLAALALGLALLLVSWALFAKGALWLSPVAPLAGIAVAWPLWAWRRLAVTSRFVHRELERAAHASGLDVCDLPTGGGVLDRQLALLEAARDRERRLRADHDEAIRLLSHDMRAPQGGILALTDAYAETPLPPAMTQRVRDLAHRTLALADGFVHLARAQDAPLAPVLLDLADIARDAAEALWPQSRQRNMPIELALPTGDTPVLVHADGALLHRLVCNLLDNALKHGTPDTPIRISVAATGTCAELEVANAGPDIPPEVQAVLFDRFARAPDAASRADGVGLGLAFVHTVVTRHAGTAWCRSANGTTVFGISLPLVTE